MSIYFDAGMLPIDWQEIHVRPCFGKKSKKEFKWSATESESSNNNDLSQLREKAEPAAIVYGQLFTNWIIFFVNTVISYLWL